MFHELSTLFANGEPTLETDFSVSDDEVIALQRSYLEGRTYIPHLYLALKLCREFNQTENLALVD